jgi:hypothetical protein
LGYQLLVWFFDSVFNVSDIHQSWKILWFSQNHVSQLFAHPDECLSYAKFMVGGNTQFTERTRTHRAGTRFRRPYLTVQPSIVFVTSLSAWLALATIIFLMKGRQYYLAFQRFFSFIRNLIVFVGACSLGANACLFIASLTGAIPVVYDVTAFLSLVLCRLVLIVAPWIQEKLMFEDVETTRIEKETEKGDDTLQYSFIC